MRTLQRYLKYCMPLAAIIAVSCFMALMMYPMMNANLKEVPLAIVSLDEGATTAQGDMNVGDTLVDKLTDTSSTKDGETPAMTWTKLKSTDEVEKGFENHDYYAALIIPKDFTAKQVAVKQAAAQQQIESATTLAQAMTKAQAEAAQQGLTGDAAQKYVQAAAQKALAAQTSDTSAQSGAATKTDDKNTPTVTLRVDNSKSPLVSNLLQQSIPTALESTGATVNVKVLNKGSLKSHSSLPTASMMSQNVLIMPTYMMSMLVAILLIGEFGRKYYATKSERWIAFGRQLVAALGWSAVVAFGSCCALWMTGSGFPPAAMFGFLWLASFALMAVFLGLQNISKVLGTVCGALGMGLGMTSGLLPYELLPEFWQKWIYGWIPQHHIGDGVRAVIYRGDGWWNVGSEPMMIILCVGLVLLICAGLLPLAKAKTAKAEVEAK